MSLAILNEALGNFADAEAEYKTAIRVEPGSIGARTNLAALYDRQFQEAQQQATRLVLTVNDKNVVEPRPVTLGRRLALRPRARLQS